RSDRDWSSDVCSSDLIGAELAGLDARDRFHVGGDAFFNPVMHIFHVGKCEMDHFVGKHPVHRKIVSRSFGTDGNADETAMSGKCLATAHTVAVEGTNLQ